MFKKMAVLAAVLLVSFNVSAATTEKMVEYKEGGVTLEGFLAQPEKVNGKTPAVVIVHEWMGLSDHVKDVARKLAKDGYIAFAADIYGKGVRPTTVEEASKTAGLYKGNRPLLRARAKAALQQVVKMKEVDSKKIVAIGYCFGGSTVLEMGRDGQNLVGIVSFHGNFDNPNPTHAKNFKGKVLALHGAIDPYVSKAELEQFETEMNQHKVDYQLVKYANAVHSFTNKAAGNDNSKGAAYNAAADMRSWTAFKSFLDEVAPIK